MTNHHNRSRRHSDLIPVMLCGRKVWIARRNSGVPEIWIYAAPSDRPVQHLRGTSLTEGNDASNLAYVESLVIGMLTALPPLTPALDSLWDEEQAEANAELQAMSEHPEWF